MGARFLNRRFGGAKGRLWVSTGARHTLRADSPALRTSARRDRCSVGPKRGYHQGNLLRLAYVSDESEHHSTVFKGEVIRFGSDPTCDVAVADPGAKVAGCHGEFVRTDGRYQLVAADADSGVWVNGVRVKRCTLRGGERIRVGSPEGPEIHVLEVPDKRIEALAAGVPLEEHGATMRAMPGLNPAAHAEASAAREAEPALAPGAEERGAPRADAVKTEDFPAEAVAQAQRAIAATTGAHFIDAPTTLGRAMRALKKPQAEVQQWLVRAQKEIRRARAKSAGLSSGHTMVIRASALAGIRQSAEGRADRSRRNLRYVAGGSMVLGVALCSVIWFQHQRISQLVSQKVAIDGQIENVFAAMSMETDEKKLVDLEARLQVLMGTAAETMIKVGRANARRAEELSAPTDELDGEIRKILRSFSAETYAIPPLFKQEIQRHVTELRASPMLRNAFAQKRHYWPDIQRALKRNQLPIELGYIAYAESGFNPAAVNTKSGAAGMWQLMEEVSTACGIAVGPPVDERLDPARSSEAAACYLSRLLVEFGEESFMLALASYNRGENGVRRALHQVAKEPGGYRKRDFWHLYRLKLLPPETREYVPRVLAAAIVLGRLEAPGPLARR